MFDLNQRVEGKNICMSSSTATRKKSHFGNNKFKTHSVLTEECSPLVSETRENQPQQVV